MVNSIKAAAARGARGLFVLVVGFYAPPCHQPVSATTTTAASSATLVTEDCDGDAAIDACLADAECSVCFSGWGAATSSTGTTCEDRFPATTTLCEVDGAGFCCNLGDEETANTCMRNGLFVTFLDCFMSGFQCSIEDMPCFDGRAFFTDAPHPTMPSPVPALFVSAEPTAFPTTPPSLSSSYADRGLELTASPSSQPSYFQPVQTSSDGEGAVPGANRAARRSVLGGRFEVFGVLCLSCCAAFVLGLVATEF